MKVTPAPGASTEVTVGAVTKDIARRFRAAGLTYGHGTFNAKEEAAWLVLHACGLPPGALEEHAGRVVPPAKLRRIKKMASARIDRKVPAAYLTNEAWLGEFCFYVDRRVIVPRSFIAELLPDGIEPFIGRPVRKALDLCTGSGCLAILLALAFPRARVDAVDLSSGALTVAGRNVLNYRLGRRVRLVRSNLFETLAERRFDLIVSNPPYVDEPSMRALPPEYRAEPRMALAGGRDGLSLVRKILLEADRHLEPGGVLVCEIGHNRRALENAFPRVPFTWLDTSAGDQLVFLLEKENLPRPQD